MDRVPHSECGGEGSIPSERTIEFRENAMDRGSKVRIVTAVVVFSISLGLFICSAASSDRGEICISGEQGRRDYPKVQL